MSAFDVGIDLTPDTLDLLRILAPMLSAVSVALIGKVASDVVKTKKAAEQAEQHAAAAAREVKNDHATNLRDDLDAVHRETVSGNTVALDILTAVRSDIAHLAARVAVNSERLDALESRKEPEDHDRTPAAPRKDSTRCTRRKRARSRRR